jgi:hypothetical protein
METELQTHSHLIYDISDMPPPLERDGEPILTMPWPSADQTCYECKDKTILTKRILWNMTDNLVIYVNLPVCCQCWSKVGWEAWTTDDATTEDLTKYLECLWYFPQ